MPANKCAIAVITLALCACYTGVNDFDGGPGDDSAGGPGPDGGADGDDGDDGSGDDGPGAVECDGTQLAAKPLQRLTRDEYNNTISDLLGIETALADSFPADEHAAGFVNNSSNPVSLLTVEKYMAAAEALAAEATIDLASQLPCDPAITGDDTCADAFIDEFGPRAFRRPLEDVERDGLRAVYEAGPDFATGIRLVIQAALQAPQFLYRVELGMPDAAAQDAVALTGHEVATRLSYLLWNTMPDDALFSAAAAGELDDSDGVLAQAQRMLEHDRGRRAVVEFHNQWLHLSALDDAVRDPDLFPQFSPALSDAMRAETETFADWVVRFGDGRLETLYRSQTTFVDDALADLYDATPATMDPAALPSLPAGFGPATLKGKQRSGILTHASLMTVGGKTDRTDPVRRGAFVREQLLCTVLPPPPPNVPEPPEPDPDVSLREQLAQHSNDPACVGCHRLIDPIGFGFENYDAVGAYRTEEISGVPVDASGELTDTDVDQPFDGAVELAQLLETSTQARECVVTQWFRYAFAHHEDDVDKCVIEQLSGGFTASGHDIRELLLTIVESESFRFRRSKEGA